jgi:hypothetical protein
LAINCAWYPSKCFLLQLTQYVLCWFRLLLKNSSIPKQRNNMTGGVFRERRWEEDPKWFNWVWMESVYMSQTPSSVPGISSSTHHWLRKAPICF